MCLFSYTSFGLSLRKAASLGRSGRPMPFLQREDMRPYKVRIIIFKYMREERIVRGGAGNIGIFYFFVSFQV